MRTKRGLRLTDTSSISDANRHTLFSQQGYLVLPGAVPADLVHDARERLSRLTDTARASGDRTSKIYRFQQAAPGIVGRIIDLPSLLQTLTLLLGPNVVMVLNRHNQGSLNDRDDSAIESRPHRDILQPSRGLVTAVVYLDDASERTGATRIIPGSHLWRTVGVPQPDGGGTWLDEHDEFAGMADQALVVPARAGDVLLFNALCFHTVGRNTTDGTRASLVLGFRSVDELAATHDREREVLVAGERLYRGNDR